MLCTKTTTHLTLSTLVTVALLIHSGCKPRTGNENAEKSNTSIEQESNESKEAKTVDTTPPKKNVELLADGTTVINGDLCTVDWNSLIDKQVTVAGDLVIVDTYDLARRGQVKVARSRLRVPTSLIDPNDSDPNDVSFQGGSNVAQVTSAQKQNDDGIIILDDGSAKQNIFPPTLFPKLGKSQQTVRAGSVVKGVSGKLVKAGNKLLLVSEKPLTWSPAERPQRPSVGEPDVTIASFNVLNYFTTIHKSGDNARGADSDSELKRQEAKLVAAILALQADVIGLMEIENNLDAENRLVAALNKKLGKDVFKGCGLPDEFRSAPGGADAIRVGIIYRADRVEPTGAVSMIRDDSFLVARTPVVQEFKSTAGGASFTVIVNHFKSKGGADRADVANKNKGDGQGAYNAARRAQSLAICTFIDHLKQDETDPRVLVIGDLNAYDQEDPIDAMRAKGLVDLQEKVAHERNGHEANNGFGHYSYLYFGQCGSLDHAMATESMAESVTGIATWHINADEPRFLDYNQEYNPKSLYKPDPFRSSDHDPVLIGIRN